MNNKIEKEKTYKICLVKIVSQKLDAKFKYYRASNSMFEVMYTTDKALIFLVIMLTMIYSLF